MCLSYIGGKSKIAGFITPHIPTDIETYVECFGGMFWVFFKMELEKYPNLKTIVYNDFNPLNANLFHCLQHHKKFSNIISDYQSQNKDLFYKSQSEIFDPNFKVDLSIPDFHTASKYALIISQVWSGTNPSKGKYIDLKGNYKSKFDTFKDKLNNPKWQDYFNKINIVENLDFEEVIEKYDNSKSYFYCDPPYYLVGEKYYANHEFGLETHKRLADTLKKIEGKFSLSYYDFPDLSIWFPKDQYNWEQKDFKKASMASSGKKQSIGTELLIMNY